MREWISQPVMDFRGRPLPEAAIPAGYAAIIDRYALLLPLPPVLAAIAKRHHPRSTEDWRLLTPRHAPETTLAAQLNFAFRYEGVDLQILARLFAIVPTAEIQAIVVATPTGGFARRLWFLYEWLTNTRLDIAEPGKVRYVPIIDPEKQYGLEVGEAVSRYKVINNLPGTPQFCPLVRRTPELDTLAAEDLSARAGLAMGRVGPDIMARAAAFLLLSDSKSSFAIEGERPSGPRTARWGQAIAQAGSRDLTIDELNRLQKIVIGDDRFVVLGLRREGGFVGVHDRDTNMPVPEHISARHHDLPALMTGIVAFAARAASGRLDAVVAAASLAFGFVYTHPYVDGNGRLHRWLIHHALAQANFSPKGMVFPISAAILRNIQAYRRVLESYSMPLLPYIDWSPTEKGNVEVLNETIDFYRFFDATQHTIFLYDCVRQTVEHDLPSEVKYLQSFDRFQMGVQEVVDMPMGQIELMQTFLSQNDGKFSKRAREKEFSALTSAEFERIEALYEDAFGTTE